MRQLIPALLLLAFTVYCLIDVVRSNASDVRGLPKPLWVVVVLLVPLAAGIAWFVAGRPRGTHPTGPARRTTPRPPVVGPDDDPDFLRTIKRPRPVPPATPLDRPSPDAPPAGATGPTDRTDRQDPTDGDDDGDGHGEGTPADRDDRRP